MKKEKERDYTFHIKMKTNFHNLFDLIYPQVQ